MTAVQRLLVGLCLIATAYAGGSQAGVKQSESLPSKLLWNNSVHSKASNCSAGGLPIPPVVGNGCPPTLHESFGAISSSTKWKAYALGCAYQLKASDAGSIVQLWFGSLDSHKRFKNVRIYDGANSTSPLIAT
ncbi:hypothetical protein AAVH_34290, partial [Aphelenchoides avenae]